MDRRRFLTLTGLGAGAGVLPGAAPVARAAPAPAHDEEDLPARLRRLRRDRKWLLVLLRAEDEDRRTVDGVLAGQWIVGGATAELLDLALCEVVGLDAAGLRALGVEAAALPVPEGRRALAVLLDPDAGDLAPVALHVPDPVPDAGFLKSRTLAQGHEPVIASLAEQLRARVAPDDEAFSRRLVPPDDAPVEVDPALFAYGSTRPHVLGPPEPRPRYHVLDRCAVQVRRDVRRLEPADRAAWEEQLAHATLLRLWEQDPEGLTWRLGDLCPPCGMGWSPEASRAFLHFL